MTGCSNSQSCGAVIFALTFVRHHADYKVVGGPGQRGSCSNIQEFKPVTRDVDATDNKMKPRKLQEMIRAKHRIESGASAPANVWKVLPHSKRRLHTQGDRCESISAQSKDRMPVLLTTASAQGRHAFIHADS